MVIELDSFELYVKQWLKLSKVHMPYRELELATLYVVQYMKFTDPKGKNDPMKLVKSKGNVRFMCNALKMDIDVLKKYTLSLKEKGFFSEGTINPEFIPDKSSMTITFTYKNG